MQHTVKQDIVIQGTGLHSGADVFMTIKPAPVGHGIVFVRTDVSDVDNVVPAKWDNVVDTRLCTVIGNDDCVLVGTIEHLMAALRGCGVDNALIELDAPEVPIMDGSAVLFVQEIDKAGLAKQGARRRMIKVLKEVSVEEEGKMVSLSPSDEAIFAGGIDFKHPLIGQQQKEIKLVNGNFRHDLANCRTFGFLHEVEALRKMGLAQGGSLDNAIVLDQDTVMNADGLRHDDEFIRHKLLDAVGDLYLAGGQIIGEYNADKPSHDLNNKLLHKLFSTEGAWEFIEEKSQFQTAQSPEDAVILA